MAKILVVDDRSFNRQFLLTLLKCTGHELLEAADGAQALAVVRAKRPDVVISDILMPTMDGFQFARAVRADPEIAATNIIFYTATYREREARALAEACGVSTVLPKPSDPEVILAAIETALGRPAPTEELQAVLAARDELPRLKRIDDQLGWYAEELRGLEASFRGVLDRLAHLLSERKEMQDLSSSFAESFAGLRRLAAKQTTLIEVMLDVNPEHGPVRLIEILLDAGRKVLGARLAAAAIFDETTKTLKHLVTRGFDGQVYLDATDAMSGVPGSLLGREDVLRRAAGEGDWRPDDFPIAHPPPRSFVGTAVMARESAYGWIYFANKNAVDFDDEDERILATLAAQLGATYANTLLFDMLQSHAAKLQIEITAREKAENQIRAREEQLAQARKMEAVGQLTGGIAHDFNNLLTVVKGNAEHLTEALGDGPLRRHVQLIEQAANRGADLVRRLLAFARKQELSPAVVDLNALLASFLKLVRRALAENIAIVLKPEEFLPPIFVDAGSLENALLNLALNARDAMEGGGTITISTAVVVINVIRAAELAVAPGRYVKIAVTDTGTGMDEAVAERAFEPFFTTKDVGKGSGLGLSMVYGFVKQSGGHAEIATTAGKGSTVTLYLPAARGTTAALVADAPTAALLSVDEPSDGSAKAKVLLVEDDELVRATVSTKLARLGYGVTAVPAARDALGALKGGRFDLVFTDVIMPGAMNGADLAREILRLWPAIKVLATSGYSEGTVLAKVAMPEGVRVLLKPYSTTELAAALRAALGA